MIQKKGSTGPLVFTIQEQLNLRLPANANRAALKTNGQFDAATEKRVREFQAMMNLTVTGIVDDVTSAVITQSSFEYEAVPRPIVILQNTSLSLLGSRPLLLDPGHSPGEDDQPLAGAGGLQEGRRSARRGQ